MKLNFDYIFTFTDAIPKGHGGIYAVCDSNGTLIYIGETNDISDRIGEHEDKGKFFKYHSITFRFTPVTNAQQTLLGSTATTLRQQLEGSLIDEYKPKENKVQPEARYDGDIEIAGKYGFI